MNGYDEKKWLIIILEHQGMIAFTPQKPMTL